MNVIIISPTIKLADTSEIAKSVKKTIDPAKKSDQTLVFCVGWSERESLHYFWHLRDNEWTFAFPSSNYQTKHREKLQTKTTGDIETAFRDLFSKTNQDASYTIEFAQNLTEVLNKLEKGAKSSSTGNKPLVAPALLPSRQGGAPTAPPNNERLVRSVVLSSQPTTISEGDSRETTRPQVPTSSRCSCRFFAKPAVILASGMLSGYGIASLMAPSTASTLFTIGALSMPVAATPLAACLAVIGGILLVALMVCTIRDCCAPMAIALK